MKRRRTKVIDLTCEMADLEDALAGARILADALSTDQLATDEDQRRAPRAITAVLVLVVERLRLLRKAMLSQIHPDTQKARRKDFEREDDRERDGLGEDQDGAERHHSGFRSTRRTSP